MAQEVKFLDMFGCCASLRDKCGGLELAKVKNVVVSREKRTMDIAAGFAAPGTPSDIAMLEWRIAAEYGFTRVKITGNTPAAAPAEKKAAPPKKEAKPAPKKAESGEVLFGKLPKDNHRTDISELTLQSGTVSVTGKVFAADSRKIQKTNAAVLSFDMTDYTGSIHVSKYIRQGDDQSILDKIRVGDYLTVRGDVIFNRYDNDMAVDVAAIAKETAPQRQDTAEQVDGAPPAAGRRARGRREHGQECRALAGHRGDVALHGGARREVGADRWWDAPRDGHRRQAEELYGDSAL